MQTSLARRGLAALATVGLLSVLLPATALANQTVYIAELTGDAVVSGVGDPDGAGFVQISVAPDDGTICWIFNVDGIDAPTAAHVHAGPNGSEGPEAAELGLPDIDDVWEDCSSGHDTAALQGIVDDPEAHYVDVHTQDLEGGAIRGQLFAIETSEVSVFAYACLDFTEVELDDLVAACRPIAATGDVGDLPDGYTWRQEPIEGLDVELEEPDGATRTIAEAGPAGGDGTCDPSTLTCWDSFGYGWEHVLAGETALTVTAPDGYRLSFAFVVSDHGTGPTTVVVDNDGQGVLFDTTGLEDGASVFLVGVLDSTATPTPSPTDDGGAAPTIAPGVTPPATSMDGPVASGTETTPWIALLLVLSALGSLVLLRPARRP